MKENYPEEKDKHWEVVLRKDIENVLNKAYPSEYLVVMRDEIIIGFGCWMQNGYQSVFSLTWINISPKEQGKGIGKALVRELEKEIIKNNKIPLHITLQTIKPIFYYKLGYRTVAHKDGDAVMLRKITH